MHRASRVVAWLRDSIDAAERRGEEPATSDVAKLLRQKAMPGDDPLDLVRQLSVALPTSIDAEFAELIETILACERWEREHPFTVATIRSPAPRDEKRHLKMATSSSFEVIARKAD